MSPAEEEAYYEQLYWQQWEHEEMLRRDQQEHYEESFIEYTLIAFLNNEISEDEARNAFRPIRHPSMFEQYVLDVIASGRAG